MTLMKNDGVTEDVEIVMTFKLDNFNDKDYVIYKSNDEYFGASFVEKDDVTELDTDLSLEEQEKLSELFEKLYEGGVIGVEV
jgi:hypothetical protein